MDAPSLEVFKTRLDEALGNLIKWVASLPEARGLELDDLLRSLLTQTVL